MSDGEITKVMVMLMKMSVLNQIQHDLLHHLITHVAQQYDLPPEILFNLINTRKNNLKLMDATPEGHLH